MAKLIDTVQGRYGAYLYLTHDRYIGRSLRTYGEFSQLEVEFFGQFIRPGDHVVEVGANVGSHTLPLSRFVGGENTTGCTGHVYAFEAQPVVFQAMCGALSLNQSQNVDAFPIALGDEPGCLFIPSIRYDVDNNFGGLALDGHAAHQAGGRRVPLMTLDSLIDPPAIRLIKVDVEGMELKVLRGATGLITQHRPLLYVENDRVESSAELIEAIMAMDYRLFWHLPPMFNPKNFFNVRENVFGTIRSSNMFCVPREMDFAVSNRDEITDPQHHPMRDGTLA